MIPDFLKLIRHVTGSLKMSTNGKYSPNTKLILIKSSYRIDRFSSSLFYLVSFSRNTGLVSKGKTVRAKEAESGTPQGVIFEKGYIFSVLGFLTQPEGF